MYDLKVMFFFPHDSLYCRLQKCNTGLTDQKLYSEKEKIKMCIGENTTFGEDLQHLNEMAETLRKETVELLKGKEAFLKAIRAVEDKHTIKIN